MKKLIYTLLLMASVSACNFLDTPVYDELDEETIYHDETTCMSGLAGIYDILGNSAVYGQNLWGDLDAGTDIMVYNRSYGMDYQYVSLYNYNNTDSYVTDTWEALYTGINRANDYIDILERRTDDDCGGAEQKAMYIGEAKALRALFYMNLVAYWGEVPLRLTPTKDLSSQLLERSSQADIYAQIIQDLKDAEEGCLPADELNAPGRISQTTAQALLARAYLWQSGYPVYANTWNEALTYARKVRDSGLHQLNYTPTSITTSMPEYTIGTGNSSTSEDCKDRSYYTNENSPANGYCSLFINMCSNLYDTSARESMFEVEFYGNGLDQSNESGKVGLYNGIQNSITTDEDQPFAYAWYDATKILVRLYNKLVNDPTTVEEAAEVGDRDARKWWNVSDYTFDTSSGSAVKTLRTNYRQRQIEFLSTGMNNVFPGKWRAEYDPIRPWARNNGSINFPVMRYSDVLLMIAEASNEIDGPTQEAIDAINEVRERAGAISMSLNDFPDQATLRQFIFEERTRELCFEVPRHMELRRMGRDFFFTRIRMLQDQSLYISNQSSSTIGYPTDNVRSVPARNLSERHIYLPIPQSELNVNTICGQNEGW